MGKRKLTLGGVGMSEKERGRQIMTWMEIVSKDLQFLDTNVKLFQIELNGEKRSVQVTN